MVAVLLGRLGRLGRGGLAGAVLHPLHGSDHGALIDDLELDEVGEMEDEVLVEVHADDVGRVGVDEAVELDGQHLAAEGRVPVHVAVPQLHEGLLARVEVEEVVDLAVGEADLPRVVLLHLLLLAHHERVAVPHVVQLGEQFNRKIFWLEFWLGKLIEIPF